MLYVLKGGGRERRAGRGIKYKKEGLEWISSEYSTRLTSDCRKYPQRGAPVNVQKASSENLDRCNAPVNEAPANMQYGRHWISPLTKAMEGW